MQKDDDNPPPNTATPTLTPVVGIGASAGGLEAMSQLIEALSPELGLAYVIVSHMDPRQESHLAEILAKHTTMPVQTADGQQIAPDHVYVIPPDTVLTISGNDLLLQPRTESGARHLPVDALFASIAEQRPGRAIGVVLSGTGSDGAQGITKIKEAAGLALVQTPDSAAFDGMPTAAIQTGCVDIVARPFEIATELAKIARHPYFAGGEDASEAEALPDSVAMGKIFELLNSVYQADFTQYKSNTVQRRLQRRMALINETEVQSYLAILHG